MGGPERIVVIGAGIGGLVAALELAAAGREVVVVERAGAPGGKMREVAVAGRRLDAGPTVFTLRTVFDRLFEAIGARLDDHVTLTPVGLLARHAWADGATFDLFADRDRAADAIGDFAGAGEAKRYRAFCARARSIYETLDETFIHAPRPSVGGLVGRVGPARVHRLAGITPFSTMWQALGRHFHDQRLRQLFARYATYCGSSPFQAPATLMLIAHVEQEGVWLVEGGMHQLAVALARLAEARGARLRYHSPADEILVDGGRVAGVRLADGETMPARTVIANADVAALATGRLGAAAAAAVPPAAAGRRSLSAVTWSLVAEARGFPLVRHSVFFGRDYPEEFDAVFRHHRLPRDPTVYVCAQDRGDDDTAPDGPERLLCLINAPPTGDHAPLSDRALAEGEARAFAVLARSGLRIARTPEATTMTTPTVFDRLFPATGGALYGQASHGWAASFARPGTTTKLAGLYLAGGSVHPGAGVPMAAVSGRLAAARVLADKAGG